MARIPFAPDIRKKVLSKTGGVCFYCGIELHDQDNLDWSGKVVQTIALWDIDHVHPVSKGGGNEIENLVPACKPCNRKKWAK